MINILILGFIFTCIAILGMIFFAIFIDIIYYIVDYFYNFLLRLLKVLLGK